MAYSDIGLVSSGDSAKAIWANGVRNNQEYFNSVIGAVSIPQTISYVNADSIQVTPGSDIITLSGDLEGGGEAANTYYYAYMPSSGVGYFSITAPTLDRRGLHPTRDDVYLGCVRNNSSSNIIKFYQHGSIFTFYARTQIYSGGDTIHSWSSITPLAPTNFLAKLYAHISHESDSSSSFSQWDFGIYSDDQILYSIYAVVTGYSGEGTNDSELFMELPVRSGVIRHQFDRTTGTNSPDIDRELYSVGWLDPFIV